MNIFFTSRNPVVAAQGLGDSHILKQILETAQLLDTAHNVSLVARPKSVFNNPCAMWARSSRENYTWLFQHFEELLNEYSYRFGKVHAYMKYVTHLQNVDGCKFSGFGWSDPPLIAPAIYQRLVEPTKVYRAYYRHGKKSLHHWTKRNPPGWLYNVNNS